MICKSCLSMPQSDNLGAIETLGAYRHVVGVSRCNDTPVCVGTVCYEPCRVAGLDYRNTAAACQAIKRSPKRRETGAARLTAQGDNHAAALPATNAGLRSTHNAFIQPIAAEIAMKAWRGWRRGRRRCIDRLDAWAYSNRTLQPRRAMA